MKRSVSSRCHRVMMANPRIVIKEIGAWVSLNPGRRIVRATASARSAGCRWRWSEFRVMRMSNVSHTKYVMLPHR